MSDYKKRKKAEEIQAGKLMNQSQKSMCSKIIHTATVACGAAGAIPIPVADAIPITATQITMVIALGKVFEIKLTETAAKAVLTAVAAPLVGRTVASSILKFIPGPGWLASAALAAGITETIGWIIANDFAKKYKSDFLENKFEQNNIEDEFESQRNEYEDDE